MFALRVHTGPVSEAAEPGIGAREGGYRKESRFCLSASHQLFPEDRQVLSGGRGLLDQGTPTQNQNKQVLLQRHLRAGSPSISHVIPPAKALSHV